MVHIRYLKLLKSLMWMTSTIRTGNINLINMEQKDLKESSTWKPYTKELKLSAVMDYLSGQYSLREVTRKYEISDHLSSGSGLTSIIVIEN